MPQRGREGNTPKAWFLLSLQMGLGFAPALFLSFIYPLPSPLPKSEGLLGCSETRVVVDRASPGMSSEMSVDKESQGSPACSFL